MKQKRVVVSVINDLSTDRRVEKICEVWIHAGYVVHLIGRELKHSLPIERPYKTSRFRMLFTKGPLFYAWFNMRLFFKLLFVKTDVFYANDLDTLWANYWVSRLRSKVLIYDSHELFTEVPELKPGSFAKKVWTIIERRIVPKLKYMITVNQSGIPEGKKILILQGSGINVDRGAEELIEAMKLLLEYHLIIVGSGDVLPILKETVSKSKLSNVQFIDKCPYQEMMAYTAVADLGLTLDKDTNLNYRYSLPNKIFDYLHVNTPVLSSDLPELKSIIEEYQVGCITPNHNPDTIANTIKSFFEDTNFAELCSQNASIAMEDLNWSKESQVLLTLIKEIEQG